ncbi:MAG TPA: hypothetical protein DDY57_13120 [Franconibacter pulveris]|nr:hypothetical protein [Franconibacter pulveris]
MRSHKENATQSGLNIIGIDELIVALNAFSEEKISITTIKNKGYFLSFYANSEAKQFLGLVVIKLRSKQAMNFGFTETF